VETTAILTPGTKIKLVFSLDDGNLDAAGYVARMDPGSGIAVQFKELNREAKEKMYRILEHVQKTNTFYNNRYFENLIKR
jgi:hypothetical protein